MELLRGRGGGYTDVDPSSTALAPFKQDLVSLPSSTLECKMIEELVGARGRFFLEGGGERMRLAADEQLTEAQLQDIPCYVDPALTRNRRKYVRFLKDLHSRGLAKFSLSCRERVGLFFL